MMGTELNESDISELSSRIPFASGAATGFITIEDVRTILEKKNG